MEKDDEVAVAEAGGGRNKPPPPAEVICGEPDDEPTRRRKIREAQRAALQAEALRMETEMRRRLRDLDRRQNG